MAKYLSSPISWSWSVRAEWVELTSLAASGECPNFRADMIPASDPDLKTDFQAFSEIKSFGIWIQFLTKHGVTTPLRTLHCQWGFPSRRPICLSDGGTGEASCDPIAISAGGGGVRPTILSLGVWDSVYEFAASRWNSTFWSRGQALNFFGEWQILEWPPQSPRDISKIAMKV